MKIYISLTSIFQRQNKLLRTLKSIVNQTLLPSKCYIYLSTEPYLLDKGFKDKIINPELNNFIINNNIFEICWCENIGPYRKILPLLKEKWNEDCLILTMDDDINYHPDLVKQSLTDYNKYKCCIAYRGFTPNLNIHTINDLVYKEGPIHHRKHLYNFANGGVGTVHHPSFYHKTGDLIFNLKYIMELCPTSDDLWYYFIRIANNVETVLNLEYINFLRFMMDDFRATALCINYNYKNNTNENSFKKIRNKFIELNLIHLDLN